MAGWIEGGGPTQATLDRSGEGGHPLSLPLGNREIPLLGGRLKAWRSHKEIASVGGMRFSHPCMTQIKFGTDGWRAVIAEQFTFANLDRVAQATAGQ